MNKSMVSAKSRAEVYTAPGMPPLEYDDKVVSFFEFWPTWLMYLPVALQWLGLAVFHRSLTLPLLANPNLPLAGMVGVPKSDLLSQATGECERAILSWTLHCIDDSDSLEQASALLERLATENFTLPFVCKPDIGCRGSGVQLVRDLQQLANYIAAYPRDSVIMIQKLATWEPEAGVFYIRQPGQSVGKIASLALKYSPYVLGDGERTLRQLIEDDPRAQHVLHLYLDRHADSLDTVLPTGEAYKLVFSASHCRGAVFRDAREYISEPLTDTINRLLDDLPDFYFGRLDIKFENIDSLQRGETIEIVEINAASSEALHIWDSKTPFNEAIGALLQQYRTLFKLGAFHRSRGFKTPGVRKLWRHWQIEKNLRLHYPATD